ncbi:MAG: hypothetical protein WBQ44_10950 [Rhodococcus sp. (in: high G+C Gram-positive bacteria)]
MTRSLAILMFDDVEVLDACGPFEVFSVANRITEREMGEPAFEVVMVGVDHALGGHRRIAFAPDRTRSSRECPLSRSR